MEITEQIKSLLFGVAVGDALGVPAEFKRREFLRHNPITGMIGHGTHHMPPGTFSDDSSLTFCLAEALTGEFDVNVIGQNFILWLDEGYWTATGTVFDVGNTTHYAIARMKQGITAEQAGGRDTYSNGNGSLMRIAPLAFYLSDKSLNERFELTRKVSSITHGHIRSIIACFYYLEFCLGLLKGEDKFDIYKKLQGEIPAFLASLAVDKAEMALFRRLLEEEIHQLPEEAISGDGYVLHTLEAAVWCLLTTDSYGDAVLKAVNLGDDTDTTGAVTGGLAGLLYGINGIPSQWISQLARNEEIEELAGRLAGAITKHRL